MPARSINFVGSINRKKLLFSWLYRCCIGHFYLGNGRAARSNQHVNKYCIALSPERHRGPWHIAVFIGRPSRLPTVTRQATTSLITKLVTVSRPLDRDVVVQLYSCRPKTGRERGDARDACRRLKYNGYCVTSFGLSPATALCCSGGGGGRLVCRCGWCRAAQSS